MWARELGARNGLVIPNQAAEHYYLITDTIDGLDPNAPVFEDPASYGYYREEGGGMMVGLFEPQAAPWKVEGIPRDFSFGKIPPDWDRMAPFLEKAMARVPVTLDVGRPHVLLRAGVVHPRPRPGGRRGPGHPELLRRRGHELRRHPLRRRARPGAWRTGSPPAARTST